MSRKKPSEEKIIALYTKHGANASKAAKEINVSPRTFQYWISNINTEKLTAVKDASNLNKARNAQLRVNKANKDVRDMQALIKSKDTFDQSLNLLAKRLNKTKPYPRINLNKSKKKIPMTIELLFSDLQIGKLGDNYNTDIAKARIQEWTSVVLMKLEQYSIHYNIERIVLVFLGDIIESDKKHSNSARATDTGTAEQIADAIESIYELVIKPLGALNTKIDIIAITGNHDHDDHGLNMFKPGYNHLSYPLYKALEKLTAVSGYKHISWTIPAGMHADTSIYGSNVLYEHGVGVSVSESTLFKRMADRSYQVGKHYSMLRIGDKHTVTLFKGGDLCVNGAFFSTDKTGSEYSSIAGFCNKAMQVMFSHVPRHDERSTLFETFCIQLDHINQKGK